MAITAAGVEVRVVALLVGCHACGARGRIANLDDRWSRRTMPCTAFFGAHLDPEILAAEVSVAGKVAIYPVCHV